MIIFRAKEFSKGSILNTRQGIGFQKHRKYDTDLDRLGRMETAQRELSKGLGTFQQEMRKLSGDLKGKKYGNDFQN